MKYTKDIIENIKKMDKIFLSLTNDEKLREEWDGAVELIFLAIDKINDKDEERLEYIKMILGE